MEQKRTRVDKKRLQVHCSQPFLCLSLTSYRTNNKRFRSYLLLKSVSDAQTNHIGITCRLPFNIARKVLADIDLSTNEEPKI